MEEKRSYYAIIPAKVRYDESLSANAKLLYGEITALANETGYCWATNDYFAKLYGVSKRSVQVWIKSLENSGYILLNFKKSNDTTIRLIKISEKLYTPVKETSHCEKNFMGARRKLHDPHEENFTQNNTINNTNNNISLSQIFDEGEFASLEENQKQEEVPKDVKISDERKQNKKKTFAQDSDPYLLAKYLETNIRRNCPSFLEDEKRRQRWAVDFDLMIRRDKLNADDIAEVIAWCQRDNFWKSNILSAKKLREKYLQLLIKMKSERS